MDTRTDVAAARIDRFLAEEPVVWLSTVRPDGLPHLVPVWFAWDGEVITIMSKPGAQKVRNLREHPSAMLALGDAEDDFDVGLLEAAAECIEGSTELPAAFVAKYADRIAQLGLTPAEFAATYSQQIRLTPRRALGWHGRSEPASMVNAARRVASSQPATSSPRPAPAPAPAPAHEPAPPSDRPGVRDRLTEPLTRGLRGLRPVLRPGGVAI